MKFINSWGTNWADGGFFKIENEKVLLKMRFYNVFWKESDLTESEKNSYYQDQSQIITNYFY
jgi:C1A family cysteine protease